MLDEMNDVQSDLAQLIRLALAEQTEDVRLFVARLVRKYRNTDPELAEQMDLYLRSKAPRASAPMRKVAPQPSSAQALPVDDESRLSLLKVFRTSPIGSNHCCRSTWKKPWVSLSRNAAKRSALQ